MRDHLVRPAPVEYPLPGFDPVPGNAIPHGRYAQLRDPVDVLGPLLVVPGQLVLVQGPSRQRVRIDNERILDPGRPDELIRRSRQTQELSAVGYTHGDRRKQDARTGDRLPSARLRAVPRRDGVSIA